jgi:hypothetical protein
VAPLLLLPPEGSHTLHPPTAIHPADRNRQLDLAAIEPACQVPMPPRAARSWLAAPTMPESMQVPSTAQAREDGNETAF